MGAEIAHISGPMSVGAAGTFQFLFTLDPKGKASMIDTIQAEIASGTRTGLVRFRTGPSVGMLREISRSALTAAAPSHRIEGNYLLLPGYVISIDFSGVTAADTVQCYIGGH